MKNFLMFLKFAAFSASAGAVQFGSYTLLYELAHFPEWLSYLISIILSVLWNFTLNRKFTFKSANNIPIAMMKVAAYYAVFIPFSTGLEWLLTERLGWNGYIATILNMLINFSTEFLYQRYFVFKDSIGSAEKKKPEKQDLS